MYVVLVLLIVLYIAFKNSERIARWLKNVLFAGGGSSFLWQFFWMMHASRI
jgi:membrane-associated PAP2 superfamily phosphatase